MKDGHTRIVRIPQALDDRLVAIAAVRHSSVNSAMLALIEAGIEVIGTGAAAVVNDQAAALREAMAEKQEGGF